jgi:NAD(P)-dependent dehydrogenase (short-subunit alcohol dehydrogenase family)
MEIRLDGKACVVTGASSGIGAAIAKELVDCGARVVATGVDQAGIARLARDLGPSCMPVVADVTKRGDMEALYKTIGNTFGRLDVVVANGPREKMLAVFDAMTEAIAKPNYRGCAFLRATAEMPADASGRQVCRDARRWTRELLSGLAKEAGAVDPDALAKQLVLLYDGAAASVQMDRDHAAGAAAKAAAALLIDAAREKRSDRARRRG